MFKFISATIVMFALTATGLAQDAKKEKKPEPIVPKDEKIFIAEDVMKYVKNVGLVQAPPGQRISFELNGDIYHVKELKYKTRFGDVTNFIVDGQLRHQLHVPVW